MSVAEKQDMLHKNPAFKSSDDGNHVTVSTHKQI